MTFANAGDDVHALGPIRAIGSMLIGADGSCVIAEIRPDPLAYGGED